MIIKLLFFSACIGFIIGLFQSIRETIDQYNLKNNVFPDSMETSETIENDLSIYDELEHLKAQKAGYMSIAAQLEKQLENSTKKQCITIKKQLLTLDNKVFTIDKKINKLLEKLE